MKKRALVLPLAILLDALFGDPPNRWHPVAWMGQALARAQNCAPAPEASPAQQMLFGATATLTGTAVSFWVGKVATSLAHRAQHSRVAQQKTSLRHLVMLRGLLLEAIMLKLTLSLRGLVSAARQIYSALKAHDTPAARHWLSWHLVSRNTSAMTETQIAAATIESLAENASDGIIAPLFYYATGGLPAAFTYRFINTADAMWGYHDPKHEWLGKVPARLDDTANLIPARFTALLLMFTSPHIIRTWRIWRRDAHKTASPNAGHPMSAMSGVLGVKLEKTAHYALGANQRLPRTSDITLAVAQIQKIIIPALLILTLLVRSHRKS